MEVTFFNLVLDTNGIERYTDEYYEIQHSLWKGDSWRLDTKTGYYVRLTK